MDPITQQTVLAAAGAGGADRVYVDDVFSTFLYDGNSSTQTITNGIDLAGEGGLTWIKKRTGSDNNELFDTERGAGRRIRTDSTSQQTVFGSSYLNAFNSNGFTLGNDGGLNASGHNYASWTFRKAPGFFDVVTYTGNGSVQNISHSLGSVPGMIITKRTDASGNFQVYHRNTGPTKKLELNENAAAATNYDVWNNTAPTASVFTVGTNNSANGANYIAYIFAHDDASFGTDEDESIIKCGSYTGNGSATGPVINLGFEPQWVLIKKTSASGQWSLYDTMRGWSDGGVDETLYANLTDAADATNTGLMKPTSTGFEITSGGWSQNTNGENYIYMAIRRPHKPPEAATEVFDDVIYNGTAGAHDVTNSLLYTDLTWIKRRTSTDPHVLTDRLRGDTKYLKSNDTDAESTWGSADLIKLDKMYSFGLTSNATGYNNSGSQPYISWNFKRAPGFFDVVAYTGNASTNNVTHNLQAVPELMIFKNRDQGIGWPVWFGDGSNIVPLQGTNAKYDEGLNLNGTTATNIPISSGNSSYNNNGINYIAYLFATLPGISKVGSYSGSSSAVDVDCGFTNGARFVLIKRTDQSGNWFVFDTARGIVSGNDPALWLNSSNAETTNTDYIDPLSSGFTVTTASGDINESGGTYIFLAIA